MLLFFIFLLLIVHAQKVCAFSFYEINTQNLNHDGKIEKFIKKNRYTTKKWIEMCIELHFILLKLVKICTTFGWKHNNHLLSSENSNYKHFSYLPLKTLLACLLTSLWLHTRSKRKLQSTRQWKINLFAYLLLHFFLWRCLSVY